MAPSGTRVSNIYATPSGVGPDTIAGFSVAGGAVLICLVWLAIRAWLQRRTSRESEIKSSFEKTAGLPSKYLDLSEKNWLAQSQPPSHTLSSPDQGFSNVAMKSTIIFPKKALIQPSKDARMMVNDSPLVVIPPGAPRRPFSFALAAGGRRSTSPVTSSRSSSSLSKLSSKATSSDSSLTAESADRLSIVSISPSLSQASKRVHQIFDPVLPDELVLRLGERVTVQHSFDDGWCIVGRPSMMNPDDIELGAVPTWCFVKPSKNSRPGRPMRVASLGVSIQVPTSRYSCASIMSWSRF